MPVNRNIVDRTKFNDSIHLPFQLRIDDFQLTMQDVYDFFFDVNEHLIGKGLQRLDDMLRYHVRRTIGHANCESR